MKTSHVVAGCWLLYSVCTIHGLGAGQTRDPGRAADLAQQANDKMQSATSPADYQEAAGLLKQAAALDPQNLDIQYTLGWVYLDRLHDPDLAYPHLAVV